jgi:hypothetical protein
MKTIIVAGCTRSGLTATMQMLHAGGYNCLGEYPAFEGFEIGSVPFKECVGFAIKLVDTHLQFPIPGEYHVIRLKRDLDEQAKSIVKFLKLVCGMPVNNKAIPKLKKSLEADYKKIDAWASHQKSCITINFEDMITSPAMIAHVIHDFVDEKLDMYKMASVIIDRPTKCLDTMLEMTMI